MAFVRALSVRSKSIEGPVRVRRKLVERLLTFIRLVERGKDGRHLGDQAEATPARIAKKAVGQEITPEYALQGVSVIRRR